MKTVAEQRKIIAILCIFCILGQSILPITLWPLQNVAFAAETDTSGAALVNVTFTSKDTSCPDPSDYETVVNNTPNGHGPYSFSTLCGTVRTVKALKNEEQGYYSAGEGAKGYVLVVYDRIKKSELAYRDWIAKTITNENGNFALPIEKTHPSVYIVVFKPEGNSLKFITSYEVNTQQIGGKTETPQNGLNIGVVAKVPDEINLDIAVQDSIPIMNKADYWKCGEESSLVYKSKNPVSSGSVKIPLVDETYNKAGSFTFTDLLSALPNNPWFPTKGTEPFKDQIDGRTGVTKSLSLRSGYSAINFGSGITSKKPEKEGVNWLISCDELLKNINVDSGDSNHNMYSGGGGLGNLTIPGTLEKKISEQEIQESALAATPACVKDDGSTMNYAEAVEKGAGAAAILNFFQNENFDESISYQKTLNKAVNDAGTNTPDTQFRDKVFPPEESPARGDKPYTGEYTYRKPGKNEIQRTYTDALAPDPAYKALSIPGSTVTYPGISIYELGLFTPQCTVSEVTEGGKKLSVNEEIQKNGSLTDTNKVTEGYTLINDKKKNNPDVNTFFEQPVLGGILGIIDSIVSIFTDFFDGNNNITLGNCFKTTDETERTASKTECEEIAAKYGSTVEEVCALQGCPDCTPCDNYPCRGTMCLPAGCNRNCNPNCSPTYRLKKVDYTCDGKNNYPLVIESRETNEGIETASDPLQSGIALRDVYNIPKQGNQVSDSLTIGKKYLQLIEATKSKGPDVQLVADSGDIATDTLDKSRFAVRIPNGSEKTLTYAGAIIRLIDREKLREGEDTGDSTGGDTSNDWNSPDEAPDPLENPGTCPVCSGKVMCGSYPECHGTNEYWEWMGDPKCRYDIPMISPNSRAPTDPSSVCSSLNRVAWYGYSADIYSTCGDRVVYAPSFEGVTSWKVTSVYRIGDASTHGGGIILEGVGNDGNIKIHFYHIEKSYISVGQDVEPGKAIGSYSLWMTGAGNNSHTHVELSIDGQIRKPEADLKCN